MMDMLLALLRKLLHKEKTATTITVVAVNSIVKIDRKD